MECYYEKAVLCVVEQGQHERIEFYLEMNPNLSYHLQILQILYFF